MKARANFRKVFGAPCSACQRCVRYDVLHYYFGLTFLYLGRSAPQQRVSGRASSTASRLLISLIAKLLRKKRFMTLQGCDVRLAGEGNQRNQWTMCGDGPLLRLSDVHQYAGCAASLSDRASILPLFDRVFYLNPELGHAVPEGQFLPYANVEIEKFDSRISLIQRQAKNRSCAKRWEHQGYAMILDALERLKTRFDFELILVEKKTHEEALALYRSADIAIDQVLAGWYGGFAVEMMAMGKPVACYIRERI